MAQAEREEISRRTMEALAKARGVRVGSPNRAAALRRGGKDNVALHACVAANAERFAADLAGVVADIRAMARQPAGDRSGTQDAWHAHAARRTLAGVERGSCSHGWIVARHRPCPAAVSTSRSATTAQSSCCIRSRTRHWGGPRNTWARRSPGGMYSFEPCMAQDILRGAARDLLTRQ